MPPEIPPELLDAYLSTRYRFAFEGRDHEFRIGRASADLARVHDAFGAACSAFITAWNPGSRPLDEGENERRNASLEEDLRAGGYTPLPARGVAEQEGWCEPSFLVPGMDEAAARALAARYGQVAFVVAGVDAVSRLVIT